MAKLDLTELFKKQAELDKTIAENHNISYATTRNKRTLSLLVELGEFANATRCFKYWSNKPSESLERVLDEYVDGLHFFLSLGVDIKTEKKAYGRTKHMDNLTDQILLTYKLVSEFYKKQNDKAYQKAFQAFLNIIPLLKVRNQTIVNAYYKKLEVNYHRQETNY